MDSTTAFNSTVEETVKKLTSSTERGLTDIEAKKRSVTYGLNETSSRNYNTLYILARQFKSSLIYLLLIAAGISFFLHSLTDAGTILVILFMNASLGFIQEYRSQRAIKKLASLTATKIEVLRDGVKEYINEKMLTVGDIVYLKEGDIAGADIRIVAADDLSVDESALTGESIPVYKVSLGGKESAANRSKNDNIIFSGSTVVKGDLTGIVFAIGRKTMLGNITNITKNTRKVSAYEKNVSAFSSFLMRVTLITLSVIFAGSIAAKGLGDIIQLLLFILALAISIVPEALPVVTTLTLSTGALKLSRKHVVIKRLPSIEDLGNIEVLCTDKTGTLTENNLTVESIQTADEEKLYLFVGAALDIIDERKLKLENSFDSALYRVIPKDIFEKCMAFKRLKVYPFDPLDGRRRVIVQFEKDIFLITLGAPEKVSPLCNYFDLDTAGSSCEEKVKYIKERMDEEGKKGLRHLAVACKKINAAESYHISDLEKDMELTGIISFLDPLKASSRGAILQAEKLGVEIKILTGDAESVARYVGEKIGLLRDNQQIHTGDDLAGMSETEFRKAVFSTTVFARVNPEQKYHIIEILKEKYTVGYQGDGINDAPALKIADVAIAVNTASDVAKDTADVILLKQDLRVITDGILYGRGIFENINKYIKYTLVGNFGNFFTIASISLFSSFLPLLPIQILLTNLLTDLPLLSIASDSVDIRHLRKPAGHNNHDIVLISLILGSISSIFEFLFFAFIHVHTDVAYIQSSWFTFVNFTGWVVIFSVRTKGWSFSKPYPSTLLIGSIVSVAVVSISLLYLPLNTLIHLVPLQGVTLLGIFLLTVSYFVITDIVKVEYYRYIATLHS